MKLFKMGICAAAALVSLTTVAQPTFIAADQTAETKICLAAVTDDLSAYKKHVERVASGKLMATKFHHIFANKLKCNEQNIAKFARQYGAINTAKFISIYTKQSVSVTHEITDVRPAKLPATEVITASIN